MFSALMRSPRRWVHPLITSLIMVLMFSLRTLMMSWIIFRVLLRNFDIDVTMFLMSFLIFVLSLVVVALFMGKSLPLRLTIIGS